MIWIIGFPRPTGFFVELESPLGHVVWIFWNESMYHPVSFPIFKGLPMWSCWIWPLPGLRKKGHSKGSPQVAPWYVTLPEANSSPENDGWKMTFPFGARPSFKGDVLLVKRSVNSRCAPPAIPQVKEGQGWNQWTRLRRYPRREKTTRFSEENTGECCDMVVGGWDVGENCLFFQKLIGGYFSGKKRLIRIVLLMSIQS